MVKNRLPFSLSKNVGGLAKKNIDSIRSNSGDIVSDDNGIASVFCNFYSNLFSSDDNVNSNLQNDLINCLCSTVDANDKEDLNRDISLEEVRTALISAANNKSPGIDGIPYEFYRKFFDVIGTDLIDVYNCIFAEGILSDSQRTAVISLIPKKGDLLNANNWRPISLLNTDYKLLAKVLQIRLSKVMNSLVNEFQTCSIPGRSIHSNMFIVRDIIEYANSDNSSIALLSLDQEKAFDKVDWGFLMKVLRKLDLGDNFIKWISILYRNINSRLLIHGGLSDPVQIARGVRQGCPLSPLLYVLFIEPIACFINNNALIGGFMIPGSGGKCVKLIQYADDATCISSSVSDVLNFINVLSLFQKATGATININKSFGLKLGAMSSVNLPLDISWSTISIKITGIFFPGEKTIQEFLEWS